MRLVEAGKLDLDEPVRTYLPDLHLADEEVAGAVAMRHLLTHTGGWVGDYFDDTGGGELVRPLLLFQVCNRRRVVRRVLLGFGLRRGFIPEHGSGAELVSIDQPRSFDHQCPSVTTGGRRLAFDAKRPRPGRRRAAKDRA